MHRRPRRRWCRAPVTTLVTALVAGLLGGACGQRDTLDDVGSVGTGASEATGQGTSDAGTSDAGTSGMGTSSGGTTAGSAGASSAGSSGATSAGSSATASSTTGGDACADVAACTEPLDCVFAATSCCGWCGDPRPADVAAIHRDCGAVHFAQVCPDPGGTPCPGCPQGAIPPTWIATCEAGTCARVDVDAAAWNRCERDEDCRLRYPTCCECGASGPLIAVPVAAQDAVQALLCGDVVVPCPECAPEYPDGAQAECAAGRCVARVP